MIVEAHTAGADDWTTLPDLNGGHVDHVPAECEAGFCVACTRSSTHYLTGGNPCLTTGHHRRAGTRSPVTSGGWRQVAFDLSAYAGKQVEVSIAYVSDPFTGGTGLFIDDTQVTTTGGTLDAEGFETGLGPWTIEGAPAGSPGQRDRVRPLRGADRLRRLRHARATACCWASASSRCHARRSATR